MKIPSRPLSNAPRPKRQHNRLAQAEESELEKLEKAVVSTQKRLDTATGKLEQAQAEGSDLVEALQTGVDKTRAKLDAAEQALQTTNSPSAPTRRTTR